MTCATSFGPSRWAKPIAASRATAILSSMLVIESISSDNAMGCGSRTKTEMSCGMPSSKIRKSAAPALDLGWFFASVTDALSSTVSTPERKTCAGQRRGGRLPTPPHGTTASIFAGPARCRRRSVSRTSTGSRYEGQQCGTAVRHVDRVEDRGCDVLEIRGRPARQHRLAHAAAPGGDVGDDVPRPRLTRRTGRLVLQLDRPERRPRVPQRIGHVAVDAVAELRARVDDEGDDDGPLGFARRSASGVSTTASRKYVPRPAAGRSSSRRPRSRCRSS